jgi:predicted nucleotidyltransferase
LELALTWPDGIAASHRRAIEQVARDLSEEFGPRLSGLLIAGSVAREEADAFSDVDLFVAFDGDWRQRRRRRVLGVDIDLFINCRDRLEKAIGNGNEVLVNSFAEGWVLYDPDQFITELQVLASNRRRARQDVNKGEAFAHTQRLFDCLKVFRRLLERDHIDAALQLNYLITFGLTDYYFFSRRWRPSRKAILADLAVAAPEFHKIACDILDPALPIGEKAVVAEQFIDAILAFDPETRTRMEGPRSTFKPQGSQSVTIGEATIRLPAPREL